MAAHSRSPVRELARKADGLPPSWIGCVGPKRIVPEGRVRTRLGQWWGALPCEWARGGATASGHPRSLAPAHLGRRRHLGVPDHTDPPTVARAHVRAGSESGGWLVATPPAPPSSEPHFGEQPREPRVVAQRVKERV